MDQSLSELQKSKSNNAEIEETKKNLMNSKIGFQKKK